MRVLHVADLHVEQGAREDEHRRVLRTVATDARALRPDLVIVAGDLYGKTVPHRSSPREREILAPIVAELAGLAPVVICYGNHDAPEDLEILARLQGDWPILVVPGAGRFEVATRSGVVDLYVLAYPRKRAILEEADDVARGAEAGRLAMIDKIASLFDLWAWEVEERRLRRPDRPAIFVGHVNVKGSRTSGGEVLAGHEIEIGRVDLERLGVDYAALGHIHLRQEPARRAWYPGSLWPTDHGEKDRKSYHVVDIGQVEIPPDEVGDRWVGDPVEYLERGRLPVVVHAIATDARPLRTLTWRWAADEAGAVGWTHAPELPPEAIAGADVRARLITTTAHVATCPWDLVREPYARAAAVWREERVVEPVISVRAPEVSQAPTTGAKLSAYWRTLSSPPADAERDAALGALADLELHGATKLRGRIAALRGEIR